MERCFIKWCKDVTVEFLYFNYVEFKITPVPVSCDHYHNHKIASRGLHLFSFFAKVVPYNMADRFISRLDSIVHT